MNEEQWINQIRQKLADYEEPAPEMLWEDIEKAMAAQKPKAKTVPMWFRKVAVAAVLLVIAVVGYKLQVSSDKNQVSSDKRQVTSNKMQVTRLRLSERRAESVRQTHNAVSGVEVAAEPEMKAEAIEEPAYETETIAEVTTSQPGSEPAQDTRTEQRTTADNHSLPPIYPYGLQQSPAAENRLSAKLYFSNTMGNSDRLAMASYNKSNSYNPNVHPQDDLKPDVPPTQEYPDGNMGETDSPDGDNTNVENPNEHVGYNGDNDSDNQEIDPYNNAYSQNVTTTSKTHHHQPIRYGLLLRYRLSERWGVETGLTYSLLTSDITTTEEGRTTESEQRLNYIGIPLKVEYMIWGNRHFNVYASAGTMVEKMVKGSLKTSGKSTKESLTIRPLQFSINGGIGAEYKYNDLFSIYVEPGIGYYFDNGSSVPTFYQDKPLNFNMNVGLRFQLNGK